MKKLVCIIWVLVVSFLSAQVNLNTSTDGSIPSIAQMKTEQVNVGYSLKLHSEILDEDRTIFIALPDDYNNGKKKYPVFYVVDAQWNFKMTTQAVAMLANNNVIPQMIYVGIHTGDQRNRDLLPTMDSQSNQGGGADNLLAFIGNELIPFVEKNYRTNHFRLLGGTSFGGTFVMHAFISEPQLFTSYLAMSPSMWWDNNVMLKRTEEFLLKNPVLQNYLFTAVANEGIGMGVDSLAAILKKHEPKGLVWKFDQYPEEIHGTVPYKATYNGLKFVFKDWIQGNIKFECAGDLLNPGDTAVVKIKSRSNNVRYTLDGSEPGLYSPACTKDFVITEPAVIKVTPFYGLDIAGDTDSLVINYLPKLTAVKEFPELEKGLKYFYYEGDWDNLPDFSKLSPADSGTAVDLNMSEKKRDNLYAMRYKGFVEVPGDNIYNFYLTSDDGSKLLIGDNLIVNNDGLHGEIEKTGKVFLTKGKHSIDIFFFQKGGGISLDIKYESKNIPKQKIPDSAFYCPGD